MAIRRNDIAFEFAILKIFRDQQQYGCVNVLPLSALSHEWSKVRLRQQDLHDALARLSRKSLITCQPSEAVEHICLTAEGITEVANLPVWSSSAFEAAVPILELRGSHPRMATLPGTVLNRRDSDSSNQR